MQMILNELSARFPVETQEEGKLLMETFLETYFAVKGIIHNDSILLDKDYRSFELAHGYRIEQWRNDPTVDVEDKRRFRALLNKSAVYNSEEFEQENVLDFRTDFQHKEYSSKGCLLAYELDGVAVSFLSSIYWKVPEIGGVYIELSDDGDLKQCQVSIPNVSYQENVILFKKYFEQKKRNGVMWTFCLAGIFCREPNSCFQILSFAKTLSEDVRKMWEYQKRDRYINGCWNYSGWQKEWKPCSIRIF